VMPVKWFLYGSHGRCYHNSIQMSTICLPIDYSNEVENVLMIRSNGRGGNLFE
jgi:hypothetical protein